MSDSDDDEIYAWVGGDNNDDSDDNKGELISGGFTGTKKRQSSSRRASKTPQYKDSSSDEDIAALSDSDHDDAVIVDQKKKSTSESKKKAALRAKIVMNAPLKKKSPKKEVEEVVTLDDDDDEEDDRKPTSVKSTDEVAAGSVKSDSNTAASKNATNEGINIVIPHSLLNKHQGTARNECIMLVQVESNDDTSHHLDFHGQSGAVGRFEADEEGVILDLKGYQYRGTIRPGPTAMVVALTRDGQFKVEAITDEFVTLDTNTRTNVMDKLNAVVKGDMDESYNVRDDNVNANAKRGVKGSAGCDGEEGGEEEIKGGKKRKGTKSDGSAPKKWKISSKK
mmetsp:Transcript_7304/g.16158  ORF Transcript_7304/g.16158 Transcript_7304/m.16158 type:complete len:337 (-) Transcript_7304:25-1035(-)